jgi:hypothetical protein
MAISVYRYPHLGDSHNGQYRVNFESFFCFTTMFSVRLVLLMSLMLPFPECATRSTGRLAWLGERCVC